MDAAAGADVSAGAGTFSAEQRTLPKFASGKAARDSPEFAALQQSFADGARRDERSRRGLAAHVCRAAPIRAAIAAAEMATDVAGPQAGGHRAFAHAAADESGGPPGGAERSEVHAGAEPRRAIGAARPRFRAQSFQSIASPEALAESACNPFTLLRCFG